LLPMIFFCHSQRKNHPDDELRYTPAAASKRDAADSVQNNNGIDLRANHTKHETHIHIYTYIYTHTREASRIHNTSDFSDRIDAAQGMGCGRPGLSSTTMLRASKLSSSLPQRTRRTSKLA